MGVTAARPDLTRREDEVLRHVRSGQSNKEIGRDLNISEQAVKALVSRLLLKFGVPNRTTLASVGREHTQNDSTQMLHEALARSQQLRNDNRVLMTSVLREMREVRGIRNKLRGAAGGAGRRSGVTSSLPPPRTRRLP